MPHLYRLALLVHVVAAFVGLAAFWVPIFSRKGGRLHKRAGWVYAIGLLIVSVTAVGLAAWTLADPVGTRPPGTAETDLAAYARGRRVTGMLLGYLAVLTFAFGLQGIQSVKSKRDPATMRTPFNIGINVLLILCAIAALAVGWSSGSWLLVGMSALGLVFGPVHLVQILGTTNDRMAWFFRHFGAMLGGGIAFHTAFLVFGAGRLIPGYAPSVWLWFLPSLVGGAGIAGANAYYRRLHRLQNPDSRLQ